MACFALPPSGNAMPAAFLLRAGDRGFPSAFAAHIGSREDRILFTDSATSALYVAFRAAAVLRGPGRVALPAWCCPSVPQAARQAGLEPVLVDLDPDTLGYAPESLAAARHHPGGLAAVLLAHFFGAAQELPPGDWRETLFIRDCAQDFDYAPASPDFWPCAYSFGRGKALNAGHGGALHLPPDGPFAEACREAYRRLPASRARPMAKALALNILSRPRLFWAISALPGLGIGSTVWKAPLRFARLSPAFARTGSACLEAYLQRRQGYRDLGDRYRALARACDPARIRHPSPRTSGRSVPTRFPLLISDPGVRDRFYAAVKTRYGGVTRMYRVILPDLPGAPPDLAGAGEDPRDPGAFRGARRVAREMVTLPVTASLMGREEEFLDFLETVLAREGALAAAADWTPAGEKAAEGHTAPRAGMEGELGFRAARP